MSSHLQQRSRSRSSQRKASDITLQSRDSPEWWDPRWDDYFSRGIEAQEAALVDSKPDEDSSSTEASKQVMLPLADDSAGGIASARPCVHSRPPGRIWHFSHILGRDVLFVPALMDTECEKDCKRIMSVLAGDPDLLPTYMHTALERMVRAMIRMNHHENDGRFPVIYWHLKCMIRRSATEMVNTWIEDRRCQSFHTEANGFYVGISEDPSRRMGEHTESGCGTVGGARRFRKLVRFDIVHVRAPTLGGHQRKLINNRQRRLHCRHTSWPWRYVGQSCRLQGWFWLTVESERGVAGGNMGLLGLWGRIDVICVREWQTRA